VPTVYNLVFANLDKEHSGYLRAALDPVKVLPIWAECLLIVTVDKQRNGRAGSTRDYHLERACMPP